MMRLHGKAKINSKFPQALAICDRCSATVNHVDLRWDMQYAGPHLYNRRFLVCEECWDVPQEQLRTIVLPQDPVPIQNARPEAYAGADNPLSAIGQDPSYLTQGSVGANIGTLQNQIFAFDGNNNAPFRLSAGLTVSKSSYQNTIGKNWMGDPANITTLSSLMTSVTNTVSSFTAYAPNDSAFLVGQATGYLFQGSSNGTNWTTLASGTTQGTAGETLAVTSVTGGQYQYHQFVLQGDGVNAIGVAQLNINVSNAQPPSN